MTQGFLFVDLQDGVLEDGKPFDALVAGTFTDMLGRKIEIKEEDFEEYVANTKRAIEATIDEGGEVVGLPIDARGHDEGDGAGWIVDIALEEHEGKKVIRFVPQWTSIGMELLTKKIRRFFSAAVDTIRKVIAGGTLTNWPATRDHETGEILLRPVSLAFLEQPLYCLDESYDERVDRVRRIWYERQPTMEGPEAWIVEVFEDHVVVDRSDGYWKVPYQMDDDEVIFANTDEWTQVRRSWVELIKQFTRGILGIEDPPEGGIIEKSKERYHESLEMEGNEMTIKLAELSEEDRVSLVDQLVVKLGLDPKILEDPPASEDAGANGDGDLGEVMAKLVKASATQMVQEQTTKAKRESEVAKLSEDLTGGTEETPVGLPVDAEKFKGFLESLTDEQRAVAKEIFGEIVGKGLVEFEERGHKKRVKGSVEFPAEMKVLLEAFLAEDKEATVAQFFELNQAELGNMADYNLSEFESKKED